MDKIMELVNKRMAEYRYGVIVYDDGKRVSGTYYVTKKEAIKEFERLHSCGADVEMTLPTKQ